MAFLVKYFHVLWIECIDDQFDISAFGKEKFHVGHSLKEDGHVRLEIVKIKYEISLSDNFFCSVVVQKHVTCYPKLWYLSEYNMNAIAAHSKKDFFLSWLSFTRYNNVDMPTKTCSIKFDKSNSNRIKCVVIACICHGRCITHICSDRASGGESQNSSRIFFSISSKYHLDWV